MLLVSAGLIPACHRTPPPGVDPGTLRINVDLAPPADLQELTFEVTRIDVAITSDPTQEAELITVSSERTSLRLVGFPGLKPAIFTSVVIPREGFLTQIRFVVQEGSAKWRGEVIPARLPSGEQTGLKAIAADTVIQIVDQATTDVTLRLDPERSFVENHGQGLIVKPVVKLLGGAVSSVPVNKFIPDRIVVLFKDSANDDTIGTILANVGASVIARDPYLPLYVLELSAGSDVLSVQDDLNALPEVVSAAPDFIAILAGQQQTLPNDPFFTGQHQWGLHNTGTNPPIISPKVADVDIDAPEAWALTTGTPSIVVAVIDAGVDINHSDLRDNIWVNAGESGIDAMGRDKRTNGVDDDGNGYVDDIHGWNFADGDNFVLDATGHGTGVAGVLGATGNNGLHISGVAWNVRIMPLRIMSRTGLVPTSAIIQALSYASRNGAAISNVSALAYIDGLQRAYYEPMFNSAIGTTLVVCAAGNEMTNFDSLTTSFAFPPMISHPQKMTIGAIMPNGEIPAWSNVGANYVDLGAPGSEIFTLSPGSRITSLDGTSFSAPFVAGTAVLIRTRFPNLDASAIKERILSGVDVDLAYSGRYRKKGRLNAYKSVQ